MKNEKLNIMRHSVAHLLAAAVLEMFPESKLGTGPATDNGFFYDFLLPRPLVPEDLLILEKKMKKIKASKLTFQKLEKDIKEAKEFFKKIDQPFKLELIEKLKEQGEEKVSFYQNDKVFVDLCAGPHVDNMSQIGSFKLTHFSGVYWQGDAKNKQLTRIYGLAFANDKDMRVYEKMIEEAKKRDHRELGKKLDLFSFHEEGAGFPFWHGKGMILKNTLIDFWRKEHQKEGYQEISTPIILNQELWHKSGHYDNYKENMYFTNIDERDYAIKPMNCPGGILIFKTKQYSYKDLPLRIGELGLVHRHELSGVLHGLFRVRSFTQDDAHIYCSEEQIEKELMKVIRLNERIYKKFDFDFHVELSTRPEKSIGSDKIWNLAEKTLEKVIKSSGLDFEINPGDGAFYGPKLDFHLKDCLGRTWQCGTLQLDFSMPERFSLEYVGSDGQKHQPVMLHRTILGSLERFIGILLENTNGFLPFWLSPVQSHILPVAEVHQDFAVEILQKLKEKNIRANIISSENSLGKRIRETELQRVPLILIIGDKEKENKSITIRRPNQKRQEEMKVKDFVSLAQKKNNSLENWD